jgi:hypothetical protein
MDRDQLIQYLQSIDRQMSGDVNVYIYGSCAQMLLGEDLRTSLDMDLAGPYCSGNVAEFRRAAEQAGLPVDPDVTYQGDHIEWIGPLRLAVPPPDPERDVSLWQGNKVRVRTVSPARLVATKLIRYDQADQADIRFLIEKADLKHNQVREAVDDLPEQFRNDPLVRENLENLKDDMALWKRNQ